MFKMKVISAAIVLVCQACSNDSSNVRPEIVTGVMENVSILTEYNKVELPKTVSLSPTNFNKMYHYCTGLESNADPVFFCNKSDAMGIYLNSYNFSKTVSDSEAYYAMSFLVHSMVRYMQLVHKVKFNCQIGPELEAYTIQNKWLQAVGLSDRQFDVRALAADYF